MRINPQVVLVVKAVMVEISRLPFQASCRHRVIFLLVLLLIVWVEAVVVLDSRSTSQLVQKQFLETLLAVRLAQAVVIQVAVI